ncbi:MAG: hypothetical protein DRI98_15195 [Bacteroidetes bacterium]|nr:MAG: hypothetical protein DRI98_15195 [Bacteroidota bacterium]
MIEQHAIKNADRIKFPASYSKDYIIERGKYTKMAYGRLSKNWQNAEDAVNNAYLSVLENPPRVEMDEESFEAFFTTVLKGTISKMLRTGHAREVSMTDTSNKYAQYLEVECDEEDREEVIALADSETNPETVFLVGEILDDVVIEIDKLKHGHRQIMYLNVLYGYKPREIFNITGDSPHNIRQVIRRFRQSMEERL